MYTLQLFIGGLQSPTRYIAGMNTHYRYNQLPSQSEQLNKYVYIPSSIIILNDIGPYWSNKNSQKTPHVSPLRASHGTPTLSYIETSCRFYRYCLYCDGPL